MSAESRPLAAKAVLGSKTPAWSFGFLYAIGFLGGFAGSMLSPLLPEIARSLGVSVAAAGQLNTVALIVGAVAGLATGTLSDVYGRRLLLTGGLAAGALGALVLAVAPTYEWALLSRALVGFGLTAPVALALVGDRYQGKERDQAVARFVGSGALAWILGAPIGGALAHAFGWRVGFGIVAGLLGVMTALSLSAVPERSESRSSGLKAALSDIWRQHRHRPDLILVLGANAARAAAFTGFLTYVSAFYREAFGLEVWQIGLAIAASALAFVLATELAGRLVGQVGPFRLLTTAGVLAAVVGGPALLLTALPVSLAALIAFGGVGGAANAAFSALVLRMATESRGATMSLNSTTAGLGSALGAAVGGLGIALLGYAGFGATIVGFSLLSAVLVSLPGAAPAAEHPA